MSDDMPDEIWAVKEFIKTQADAEGLRRHRGVYVGTGTWIDEPDGDDCVRYIRSDHDAEKRKALEKRLRNSGGICYAELPLDGDHTKPVHRDGKVITEELVSDLLAYLSQPEAE